MELTEGQKRYRKYKETYKKYSRKYRNSENGKEIRRKYRKIARDRERFGGTRDVVLKRDNYQCVRCGLTNEEHMDRYQRGLTVDHINGLGINVPINRKDNRLENLQTLCLYCHGKKDNKQSLPKSIRVAQFSLKGELIKNYDSLLQVWRETGISNQNLGYKLRDGRSRIAGYIWRRV